MISDEKFRKKEHLLKTRDFAKVYKKGSSVKKDAIVLCYLPNGIDINRLGFSISSGKVRLASSRNKIRRLLKEIYRRAKKYLKSGFDLVLVIRRDISGDVSYKSLEGIFLKLLKDSAILK